MKFKTGDALDTAHCTAIKHEFLRCEDAFKDFETYGRLMIMKAQAEGEGQTEVPAEESRLIAYKTYNAYARFIHHLYEFMLGAVQRDRGSTEELKARSPAAISRGMYNGFSLGDDRQYSTVRLPHGKTI